MPQTSVTSTLLKLPRTRLAFARLWKPKAFQEGQDPRFEATFLLDPSDPAHLAALKDVLKEASRVSKEFFGVVPREVKELASKIIPGQPFDAKTPADGIKFSALFDGNTKAYDGYADMWAIASHNKTRPTVANRQKGIVNEGDKQAPYSGCLANGAVTIWTQNNKWGKRLNFNLKGVQFVNDGPAFGVQSLDPDEAFDEVEDEEGTLETAGAADEDFFN